MTYADDIKSRIFSLSPQKKIRAAIYARVSTDNEGQKNSCQNQIEMAKSFIILHPNITLFKVYIDDGLSAKNDFNRPQYNQLLDDIDNQRIDLVIAKSMSRLNRNEFNSLVLMELMIKNNVTILTLEDNIVHNFEDRRERLFNSLKFAMDADYVADQSVKGHQTQENRIKKKELSAKDISWGYLWDKEKKEILIDQSKSEIVIQIFEKYVFKQKTLVDIKDDLYDKGIILSTKTISHILQDERYIGNFYINKQTSKLGTGSNKSKRIKLPKDQWVLIERPDLTIVDSDLYVMAQKIRRNRLTYYPDREAVQAHFQGVHKFSAKLFCACCKKTYHFGYADRAKTIPYYRIRKQKECMHQAPHIYEKDLEEITKRALKAVIEDQSQVCESLEKVLMECVKASQNSSSTIEKLKKQKEAAQNQFDSYSNLAFEQGLIETARNRVIENMNKIEERIKSIDETIINLETTQLDNSFVSKRICIIKEALADLKEFTTIDRERILNYIERIDVHENGDMDMILKSGRTILITTKSEESEKYQSIFDVVKMDGQDVLYSSQKAYRLLLRL